ncbi:MAG: adenylyl-sulfate kinase [Bacteroidales bacterium]
MQSTETNQFTGIDWSLLRKKKAELLCQHAKVVWMCGLSGAGKSTIAAGLEKIMFENGYLAQILDGDILRAGLNKDLSFSEADRMENLRRIAEISKLMLSCSIISINAFISPTEETRKMAKEIIGQNDFIEVYINAPLKVCELRDTKGLYEKARKGIIGDFTGVNAPFEPPQKPDIEIQTDNLSIDESINKLYTYLLSRIAYK